MRVPYYRRIVTLEEFTSLMMGAMSGRNPKETLHSVFTLLSMPSEEGKGLITLEKLNAACKELKVCATFPAL
jgi:hypothetical protein